MRTIRRIKGYEYRECNICGRVWNVSALLKGSYYVCPECEQKQKRVRRTEAQVPTASECERTERSNSFATASIKSMGSPNGLPYGEYKKKRPR